MGADDPYIGVRIANGDFRLVAKIGEGAMGAVYRAIQEATGTEVAVKILHMKFALEREFVERFNREVKVLRSLRHPNTVRIIDDGQMDDSSLYIVMELLQGRGLDHALKHDGPWPLDRAISMVLRVAYALEEAHRLGIVHRDLKPENIFLVERPGGLELPKLLDFGLAKMSRAGDSGSMSLTQEGDILGTPAFMSPEQSFGEALDGRADIYSLGVILYELLTGELPYEENSSGPQIARYLNDPIPIDQRVEGLLFPAGLWPAIARALQKLPEDRYSTAIEMADALKPFNTMQLSIAPPMARSKLLRPSTGSHATPQQPGAPPSQRIPPSTPLPPASQRKPPITPLPPPPSQRRPPLTPLPPSHQQHRRSMATLSSIRPRPQPKKGRPVLFAVLITLVVLAAIAALVAYFRR